VGVGICCGNDFYDSVMLSDSSADFLEQKNRLPRPLGSIKSDLYVLDAADSSPQGGQGGGARFVGCVSDGDAHRELGRDALANPSDYARKIGTQGPFYRILYIDYVGSAVNCGFCFFFIYNTYKQLHDRPSRIRFVFLYH
jgi:hypothetical protein